MPRDEMSAHDRFEARVAHALASVAPIHTAFTIAPDAEFARALLSMFGSKPDWATPGSVSPADALFLGEMIRATRPRTILEIGVAAGCSTAALAWSAAQHTKDPTIIALDAVDRWYIDPAKPVGCAVESMLAGDPSAFRAITLRTGCTALDAHRFAPLGSVDLAFIDADHRHPWPILDALAILDLVREGGWILAHDTRLAELAARHARKTGEAAPWAHTGPAHLLAAWLDQTIPAATESGNIAALRVGADRESIRRRLLEAIDAHLWEVDPTDPGVASTIARLRAPHRTARPRGRTKGIDDARMCIALVSREFPPAFGGGIGTAMAHSAAALVGAGHSVHVVTVGAPGERSTVEPVDGLVIHRVPDRAPGTDWWASRLDFSVRAAGIVERLARDTEIDVVEYPECEAPALAHCLAQAADGAAIPTVVQLHTPTEALFALGSSAYDTRCASLWNAIGAERACVGLADAVYAPSRFIADWAHTHWSLDGAPRVVPYPHPARLVDPMPIPATTPRIVLYAGRLEPRKGVIPLALAWNHVAERHPDAVLMIAGADTTHRAAGGSIRRKMLESMTQGASRRVIFSGPVPPGELVTLMDRASICVTPSIWENFPNVVIEALCRARPVVVSDRGGMREMLDDRDAGVVFRSGDVDSLATALCSVLNESSGQLTKRGLAGRRAIERVCDPVSTTAARIAIYRDAIARAGRRSARTRDPWVRLAERVMQCTTTHRSHVDPLPIMELDTDLARWVNPARAPALAVA